MLEPVQTLWKLQNDTWSFIFCFCLDECRLQSRVSYCPDNMVKCVLRVTPLMFYLLFSVAPETRFICFQLSKLCYFI